MLVDAVEVKLETKVFDRARRSDGESMGSPTVSVNDNGCGRSVGFAEFEFAYVELQAEEQSSR